MKCNEVRPLLAAYLDDEVSPSEREALHAHISGCEDCQRSMAALWKTQSRLKASLQSRASAVTAPADAWEHFQARLAATSPGPSQPVQRVFTAPLRASDNHNTGEPDAMNTNKKKLPVIRVFSIAAATLAVAAFVTIVIIKPLVAPDSSPAKKQTPTEPAVSTEGIVELTPTFVIPEKFPLLEPTRLPEGMYYMTTVDLSGLPGKAIVFYNVTNDDFMIVRQILAGVEGPLPEGEEAKIGSLSGVILTGQNGTTSIPSDGDGVLWREVNYSNATVLSWDTIFNTRVDITTTLDKDKTIEYANSLAIQFTPFAPGDYFPIEGGMSNEQIGVFVGQMIQEDHYMGTNGFISLNQSANAIGEALGGEAATLADGTNVILYRGESGVFKPAEFFGGSEVTMIGGGGGGGGGGPDTVPYEPPAEIPYSDGARLVWVKDGVRLEATTNLAADELTKFASGLRRDDHPHSGIGTLITGALIDQTVLPAGGAMVGYELNRPDVLYQQFYGQAGLTVTEGDGLIIEMRYFNNDQFVILTSRKDDGQPLEGAPVKINGADGVFQAQVGGTALLNAQWDDSAVLQDRVPRYLIGLSGGGGGQQVSETPTWPAQLDFQNGTRIEWKLDGARISLLTNLPQDQALDIAGQVEVVGKTGMLLHPNSPINIGQIFVSGYDLYGPTYIPAGLDTITPASDTEGTPAALFAGITGDSFVRIEISDASQSGPLPQGEAVTVNGNNGVIETVSGSFETRYLGPEPRTFIYTDAVQITWQVGNTLIRIMTNLSREEAIKVGESMQIAK